MRRQRTAARFCLRVAWRCSGVVTPAKRHPGACAPRGSPAGARAAPPRFRQRTAWLCNVREGGEAKQRLSWRATRHGAAVSAAGAYARCSERGAGASAPLPRRKSGTACGADATGHRHTGPEGGAGGTALGGLCRSRVVPYPPGAAPRAPARCALRARAVLLLLRALIPFLGRKSAGTGRSGLRRPDSRPELWRTRQGPATRMARRARARPRAGSRARPARGVARRGGRRAGLSGLLP